MRSSISSATVRSRPGARAEFVERDAVARERRSVGDAPRAQHRVEVVLDVARTGVDETAGLTADVARVVGRFERTAEHRVGVKAESGQGEGQATDANTAAARRRSVVRAARLTGDPGAGTMLRLMRGLRAPARPAPPLRKSCKPSVVSRRWPARSPSAARSRSAVGCARAATARPASRSCSSATAVARARCRWSRRTRSPTTRTGCRSSAPARR